MFSQVTLTVICILASYTTLGHVHAQASLQSSAQDSEHASNKLSFEDIDWKLVSEGKDNYQVFTKKVSNHRLKAVKAYVTLDASLEDVLMVLADVENFNQWIPFLSSSEFLEKPNSLGDSIIYFSSKLPWPVKNRDVVFKTSTKYNPENKKTTIHLQSTNKHKEVKKGLIRIPYSEIHLSIYKTSGNKVYLELISHSDIGGGFPKWLVNFLVTKTPKLIFSRLKKEVKLEENKSRAFDSELVFGKHIAI